MFRGFLCAFVLTGCAAAFANEENVVVSRDGRTKITLPDGWVKIDEPSAQAQMAAGNASRHEFLQVVSEDSTDFNVSLPQYAERAKKYMLAKLQDGRSTTSVWTYVNGQNAIRFELHGVLEKVKYKVGYSITLMKLGNRYIQVISWTGESTFAENLADLNQLAACITEVRR